MVSVVSKFPVTTSKEVKRKPDSSLSTCSPSTQEAKSKCARVRFCLKKQDPHVCSQLSITPVFLASLGARHTLCADRQAGKTLRHIKINLKKKIEMQSAFY